MTSDPLQLERHTAFAARLARGLVVDENAADDLVQETWLAVLRTPPRDASAVRSYIATTLRRFATRSKRSESRRAERERDTARGESLPSSEALAAAMEQHQRVVAALLELNDATRTSILLRYLEDLPPRDIAARSGEPVETVRTRIKRGLASLRERLDEREGGRGVWAAVLAPLSGAATSAVPTSSAPLSSATATGATGASSTIGITVMTLPTKLSIGIACAIAAGLVWQALGPRAETGDEPGAPAALSRVDARAIEEAHPSSVDDVEAEPRVAVALSEAPAEAPAAPAAPTLTGSIRVVDADGVEHRAEEGSLTIKGSAVEVEVAVVAGRFVLARPEAESVRVGFVELGGRPAFLASNEFTLPALASGKAEETTLDLVATWAPPSVLRVVDARTGTDLHDLTILRGVQHARAAVHPGWTGDASVVFAREAASPLELSAFSGTESWWVHAPGYVWGWVRVDHRTGGERQVALEPGGARLTVRLDGFQPDLNLRLHVFPAGWERSFESLATVRYPTEPVIVFDGVPPGAVQVRAELGIWHDGPHELAREELELVGGVASEVVLDLQQNGGVPAAVPLAGRIVLPASHPDLDFSFELLPLDGAARRRGDRIYSGQIELERVDGQPRVRRFDGGVVTPGRYLFVSSPLQVWSELDIGPGGAPDVEIALPELGEVRVRVVDEVTGARLAPEKIVWSASGRPEELLSWTLASVDPDPETLEYVFVAPLRRISLDVGWDEYADAGRAVDVVDGADVEVRVRRLPGVWLRLVDGDATVPFEWSWGATFEYAGGSRQATARITRIEDGRAWVAGSEVGTYVMELPRIEGFRPVAPPTLELGWDAAERRIELERL